MSSAPPGSPRPPEELAARLRALEAELGDAMTLDGLTRDFSIFQRRRGHRHSIDDLLTAWYAATHGGAPATMIDLGTGIGSVGMALAWYFPGVPLTAVEVQEISFRLLRENLWANGLEGRARAIHGDLRDSVPPEVFDLVSGSPPYFDVKNGIVSADSQRAGARFELKGDVRDYCLAARRVLAPSGRFVFCFPTAQRARAEKACAAAELFIVSDQNVVPKQGVAPLFSLFACRRAEEAEGAATRHEEPFVVRDGEGVHTEQMTAARALFGMVK